MMPPHPVLAELVWEVVKPLPPEDEIRLPLEVVEEAEEQSLEPAEIERHMSGTRIWQLAKFIARNDLRIATEVMLLLMTLDILMRLVASPPAPQPAPQLTVNVNVTVDTDEVAEKGSQADPPG